MSGSFIRKSLRRKDRPVIFRETLHTVTHTASGKEKQCYPKKQRCSTPISWCRRKRHTNIETNKHTILNCKINNKKQKRTPKPPKTLPKHQPTKKQPEPPTVFSDFSSSFSQFSHLFSKLSGFAFIGKVFSIVIV